MNYIPVCLVIFIGCVQALGSDDTSDKSEDFSNLLSSEEDSEDIILANNKEGSLSEENSKEKYGQKIDIEDALKTFLFSDEASDDDREKKKNLEINNLNENLDTPDSEKNANVDDLKDSQEDTKQFSENRDENERVKEVNKENPETSKESDPEPGNIIGSYVLWRPYVLDYTGILQAEKNYYKTVAYIKEFLEGGFDIEEEEGKEKMGWKADTEQLDLPRVAALSSNNEPDLYDNIANSFNNLKETVNDVVSRPEVKDNMFYILMGLTGFLMLALFNDNIFKKTETRTVQEHYLLPDSGASAKLPTYEECVKADKNILVNIGDNESFNKVDLSLPLFVVDTEKDGQRKTNKE